MGRVGGGRLHISPEPTHAEAHTLAFHTTKAHAELSDAPEDAHHTKFTATEHDADDHSALPGLLFVRADKDSDGDFDPLTAAAWENSTKSGNGTINLNTVFGVPTESKAVKVIILGTDGTPGTSFNLKAKSTTSQYSLAVRVTVANIYAQSHGSVAIAADGTIYYSFSATWDAFYLRVVGWYI